MTKLNSELNNEIGVESIEMCRLVLFNLDSYNVNTTKEYVKYSRPLTSPQCEDQTINMPNVSLNLPVNESTNNPAIELSNGMLSDDQFNYDAPDSHNIIG